MGLHSVSRVCGVVAIRERLSGISGWSAFTFLVGLGLALYALYFQIYGATPHITYSLTGGSDVLDVRRPVEDMAITYRGENIQVTNRNLRIMSVRVLNDGRKDILPADFDSGVWGIRVRDCEVVAARLVDSNSAFLTQKLQPILRDWTALQPGSSSPSLRASREAALAADIGSPLPSRDIVPLKKVIFDREKYFVVELLVIYSKGRLPTLQPVGKVAGIDRLFVNDARRGKPGFGTEALSGGFAVQAVRALVYTAVVLILLLAALLVGLGASEMWRRAARRRRERQVKGLELRSILEGPLNAYLVDRYIAEGLSSLRGLRSLLDSDVELRRAVKLYRLPWSELEIANVRIQGPGTSVREMGTLIKLGAVQISEDRSTATATQEAKDAVAQMLALLG